MSVNRAKARTFCATSLIIAMVVVAVTTLNYGWPTSNPVAEAVVLALSLYSIVAIVVLLFLSADQL